VLTMHRTALHLYTKTKALFRAASAFVFAYATCKPCVRSRDQSSSEIKNCLRAAQIACSTLTILDYDLTYGFYDAATVPSCLRAQHCWQGISSSSASGVTRISRCAAHPQASCSKKDTHFTCPLSCVIMILTKPACCAGWQGTGIRALLCQDSLSVPLPDLSAKKSM
jgi:hypothetical protein